MKYIVIILVIFTFIFPLAGSIVFILFAVLLDLVVITMQHNKLEPKNVKLNYFENKIVKKYHFFLRLPTASRIYSATLATIQLSAYILTPWLWYKRLRFQGLVILLNYILAGVLARKTNPIPYLRNYVYKGGRKELLGELQATESLLTKLFKHNVYEWIPLSSCKCKKYQGKRYKGVVCDVCNTEV